MNAETKFADWYAEWIETYKKGAVRDVTLRKYEVAEMWVAVPRMLIGEATVSAQVEE